jgi:hypothetical protein
MPVYRVLPGRRGGLAAASGSAGGARLVSPGVLAGDLTDFSRAQVGDVAALRLGSDAQTWSETAFDVARFVGASRGLLIEGDRTNAIRNAGFNGGSSGVIGSGGAAPTNMVVSGVTGLTVTLTVGTSEDGLRCIDIEYAGTPTAGTWNIVFFETTTGAPAASGEVWQVTQFVKLLSGSLAGVTSMVHLMQFVGATTTGAGAFTPTGAALGTQRYGASFTAGAGTTAARPGLRVVLDGSPVAFKIRIGLPQAEGDAAFASSPIVNPISVSSIANARGADILTASATTLFPSGIGTLLFKVNIPQNAPSGLDQTLLQLDAGSANDRVRVRNVAGGATIVMGKVAGGTPTDATSLGSMTAGTSFKGGLAFDGTNLVAGLAGGSAQTIAGSIAGLSTLRIGMASGGASGLFGTIEYLDALPYAVADIIAAAGGLP